MNLQAVFCPYEECPDKGAVGKGNIVWWQRARKRCKCQRCGRTFSYRRGTMFEGLRTEERIVSQVVTLLAYGCPSQAIVAAFELDVRTVYAWQHRAGQQAQAVQEAHVTPVDLQQVQVDELWIKVQGRHMLWVGMAIMVSTRLWLGAVVSGQRDQTFIRRLAGLVRRWACNAALYITFDGLPTYQDAFERAFSDPGLGLWGRWVHNVWPSLTLAQVVKYPSRLTWVLRGSCTSLARLRTLTQLQGTINTAFIERLNGSFRAYLAPFTRRTHALPRTLATVSDAVFLFGVVYNFCRLHSTLKHSTPAMAAHLTDHPWSIAEVLWYHPPPPSPSSTV